VIFLFNLNYLSVYALLVLISLWELNWILLAKTLLTYVLQVINLVLFGIMNKVCDIQQIILLGSNASLESVAD
jgi:hypothetical protein